MTWFSLPAMRADKPPAFADMAACTDWLNTQPLANAPLMQEVLATQLDSLNGWQISPRERYKILETLRKAVVAIETESIKRYEYRPLPLLPIEQKAFDASCRIWRGLAIGYLHCLRACLDGDSALAEHRAKIAHRTLVSLRLEQLSRYRGGSVVPGSWWRLLHAVLASAEQLGVTDTSISDRLFAETRESTPAAQYAMAILLHLSRPHELSRSQFSAAVRWLARWREQAKVLSSAAAARDARSVLIDLSSDTAVHTGSTSPAMPRWLVVDNALGKLKNRIKSLREGQSPEELRLGAGLPADACIGLMQFLHGALQSPSAPLTNSRDEKRSIGVSSTIEGIHRLLGGKPVGVEVAATTKSNRTVHEQIAIFGHAGAAERIENAAASQTAVVKLEQWKLVAEGNGELTLLRAPGSDGERLGSRSLVAVSDPIAGLPSLAMVRSLAVLEDGSLCAIVRLLPSAPLPFVATGREKMTNRVVQYPAIFLPAAGQVDKPASLFVPAGAMAKLTRLDVSDLPDGLKVGSPLDRGANFERLRCE
ncbi:MAG: cyclic-di-GMP-binding protein [Pseudomonadota bacterium]|nr:cyclic-di-GMP-binding protein [Pseudomonadota bacterium]